MYEAEVARLAPKERDVLSLVAKGRANKQVAVELGMAEETVKGHLKSIFIKLDVESRAHAAAIWVAFCGPAVEDR